MLIVVKGAQTPARGRDREAKRLERRSTSKCKYKDY